MSPSTVAGQRRTLTGLPLSDSGRRCSAAVGHCTHPSADGATGHRRAAPMSGTWSRRTDEVARSMTALEPTITTRPGRSHCRPPCSAGGRLWSMGAAAGWYPDPDGSGGQRYFDGRDWTGHRAPPPVYWGPPPWKGALLGRPALGPGALADPGRRLGARALDGAVLLPV